MADEKKQKEEDKKKNKPRYGVLQSWAPSVHAQHKYYPDAQKLVCIFSLFLFFLISRFDRRSDTKYLWKMRTMTSKKNMCLNF